jgi:hypothetical protein
MTRRKHTREGLPRPCRHLSQIRHTRGAYVPFPVPDFKVCVVIAWNIRDLSPWGPEENCRSSSGAIIFFLPKQEIRHFLISGQDVTLLLPGGVIDAESKVSACRTGNLVLVTVCGWTFFLRWSDFVEVARGDVQWAPLKLSREGAVP